MSVQEAFTPEEWKRVIAAPMLVGMAVTAADAGGLFSAFQESAAVARAIASGAQGSAGLIAEVAKRYASFDNRAALMESVKAALGTAKAPAEVVAACETELGKIAGMVSVNAAADAPAFTDWLLGIAQGVAEAGKEGGFLGFGGVAVSPAETATIEKLRQVLAVTGPAA